MQDLAYFFSNFALAQMLMCALLLIPLWKTNQSIRLYILLMLCSCGYMLGAVVDPVEKYALVWWLSSIGGNGLTGIFWLISLSVFGDHVVLKRWQYGVASLTLLIPLIKIISEVSLGLALENYSLVNNFYKSTTILLELSLLIHALYLAGQQWRDDLVQKRRYIRGAVICFSALYLFLVIVLEQIINYPWLGFDLLKAGALACLVTSINFFLFTLREASLFEIVKRKSTDITANKLQTKELKQVLASMVDDKLYQQDGITISSLAKHLSIQEYKLRQLINGELNYRNFNDFLNFYRIKEITEKLEQDEFNHLPILTLALESGFRSLSSFNKAFKTTHEITPTEYRKKYSQ